MPLTVAHDASMRHASGCDRASIIGTPQSPSSSSGSAGGAGLSTGGTGGISTRLTPPSVKSR
eukprot:scaffold113276_cov69-Phaeocystis_antarctica.AAC.3